MPQRNDKTSWFHWTFTGEKYKRVFQNVPICVLRESFEIAPMCGRREFFKIVPMCLPESYLVWTPKIAGKRPKLVWRRNFGGKFLKKRLNLEITDLNLIKIIIDKENGQMTPKNGKKSRRLLLSNSSNNQFNNNKFNNNKFNNNKFSNNKCNNHSNDHQMRWCQSGEKRTSTLLQQSAVLLLIDRYGWRCQPMSRWHWSSHRLIDFWVAKTDPIGICHAPKAPIFWCLVILKRSGVHKMRLKLY